MYRVIVKFSTNDVKVDFKYLSQASNCVDQAMKFPEFVSAKIEPIEEENEK